ncbi:MAG: pyruvate kinase [Dehalococcoidia bacterium]|jgi:pyruvate kinase
MYRKTKIVCTIGPASRPRKTIERLAKAGMNVARINLSHGTLAEHEAVINDVRDTARALNIPIAILLDLPGPKIRTGALQGGRIMIEEDGTFSLVKENVKGDATTVSVNYPSFFKDIKPGNSIFLNDGAIELKVVSAGANKVQCRVIIGGELTENKGVNLPGVKLNLPSTISANQEQMAFGVEHGVDFFAVSFVCSPADITERRRFLHRMGVNIPLIAKVEKPEAIKKIDGIIREADGIMVARGDLGIEMPLEEVPVIQKSIVRKCNNTGKPVIVATQMLESMINSARPTRAEVSDVANAIFDGADAVMLSGETAVGKYPVQAAGMMAKIAIETECALPYEQIIAEKRKHAQAQTDDAISYAACAIAQQIGAACIVAYTRSGSTALRVSKYKPKATILAITPDERTFRRLALSWGVEPYLDRAARSVDAMFIQAARLAVSTGLAQSGDLIAVTAGIPTGVPGSTNMIKVHRIE